MSRFYYYLCLLFVVSVVLCSCQSEPEPPSYLVDGVFDNFLVADSVADLLLKMNITERTNFYLDAGIIAYLYDGVLMG